MAVGPQVGGRLAQSGRRPRIARVSRTS